mmetsp:Transcript_1979/g.4218  ORF Transcript_1979/g.4218 Transcript_1979/m.4218 type:complete len:414 (+) Transcript_1979:245-1486(+)
MCAIGSTSTTTVSLKLRNRLLPPPPSLLKPGPPLVSPSISGAGKVQLILKRICNGLESQCNPSLAEQIEVLMGTRSSVDPRKLLLSTNPRDFWPPPSDSLAISSTAKSRFRAFMLSPSSASASSIPMAPPLTSTSASASEVAIPLSASFLALTRSASLGSADPVSAKTASLTRAVRRCELNDSPRTTGSTSRSVASESSSSALPVADSPLSWAWAWPSPVCESQRMVMARWRSLTRLQTIDRSYSSPSSSASPLKPKSGPVPSTSRPLTRGREANAKKVHARRRRSRTRPWRTCRRTRSLARGSSSRSSPSAPSALPKPALLFVLASASSSTPSLSPSTVRNSTSTLVAEDAHHSYAETRSRARGAVSSPSAPSPPPSSRELPDLASTLMFSGVDMSTPLTRRSNRSRAPMAA